MTSENFGKGIRGNVLIIARELPLLEGRGDREVCMSRVKGVRVVRVVLRITPLITPNCASRALHNSAPHSAARVSYGRG